MRKEIWRNMVRNWFLPAVNFFLPRRERSRPKRHSVASEKRMREGIKTAFLVKLRDFEKKM